MQFSARGVHETVMARTLECVRSTHQHMGRDATLDTYKSWFNSELRGVGLSTMYERSLPLATPEGRANRVYRVAFLVELQLAVDILSVEAILPEHEDLLQLYLLLDEVPAGLLVNFRAADIADGVRLLTS
jgi:iron complex transport system substrate-binding protein